MNVVRPSTATCGVVTSANASEIVDKLMAGVGPADADASIIAAQAIRGASARLSEYLGTEGSQALIMRAWRRASEEQTALRDVTVTTLPTITIDGVAEAIETHGGAAVAAALRALLQNVVELLERLVGTELATKLLEHPDA